jgi:meiosis-specific transcription factor NDT80
MASENHFSTEEPCIDQMSTHAHHNSFAAAVPEQLRRDGALAHTATGMPLSAITSRYSAPRPDAT